jgi:hypothetical protein
MNNPVSRRRNLLTPIDEFRFRRTGFSMYFFYNTYPQIICIFIVDIVLLLMICFIKKYKQLGTIIPYVISAVHKLH